MKTAVSFTTNTTTQIIPIRRNNKAATNFTATILVYGTFGGGTLSLYLSPDNGTTLIPLTATPSGSSVAFTANGMTQVFLGHASTLSDGFSLYATLSAATSPTLTVACYDNNQ